MKTTRHLITAFAALCFTTATTMVQAQVDPPANDHCEDVVPLALAMDSTLVFTGTNEGATFEGDNVPGSGLSGFGQPVVWIAYTTMECSNVTISFCGSTAPFFTDYFWDVVTMQCPADALVGATGYNNNECSDGQPVVHFNELPAGTYYYPVWADPDDAIGEYVISVSAAACAAAGPPNDLCSGAQSHDLAIDGTLTIDGDNTGATDTEGFGMPVVWESFTLAQCANVTMDYCGTDPAFTTVATGIYSDCPATMFIDTTSADTCLDGNMIYTYEGLAPGIYWIPVVMDVNDAMGNYTINVAATACAGPANNYCNGAEPHDLAVGDTLVINGDNAGATDNEGLGYASVWESFTITECADVELSYCGTDPIFTAPAIPGIYADCPATDLIGAASYDVCADGNLIANFEGLAAGTYWIPVVIVPDESVGPYVINVSATACPIVTTPPNDLCAAIIPNGLALGDTLVLTGDNTGATDSEGLGFASVWEAITIAECANVTIDYCNADSAFSAFAVGIYADCPATQLIPATAVDSCANGDLIQIFEALTPGTYWIPVLMDTANAMGMYTMTVSAAACDIVAGPVNDLCTDADPHVLALGDTLALNGDNTGATDSEGLGYANVWESITITGCASVSVDYCGTDSTFTAFAIGIYRDCPATQLIQPSSTDTCASGNPVQVFEELAAGTYWIPVLMDPDSAVGVYSINVTAFPCDSMTGPVNDLCSDADQHVLIAGDSLTLTGDNTGATDSEGLGYANVWESITITECASVTVDYCSTDSTFTVFALGIYSDCPAMQLIQPSSIDSCAAGSPALTFNELAAGTYWIPVWMDTSSAVGEYSIHVTAVACDTVAPPANDLCAAAASIIVVAPDSCATGVVIGDNLNATGSGDMPTCADPDQSWQDVWYTFNSGDADEVTISLVPGTIDGAGLEVFAACGDSSLACSIDGEPIELTDLTDTIYHVRIFTQEDGTPGTFALCVTSDNTTGVNSMERGTVHLYPNPGSGDITFVPSLRWTDARIAVLDMTGRTVHVEHAELQAGEAYQLFLAGELKAGSYLLHVTSAEGSSVVKLMVK